MLYMVIEDFKGDPVPVYRRFRDRGRLAPEGLRYVGSWVTNDIQRCYQLMECDEPMLLQQWLDAWKDLVDFQVVRDGLFFRQLGLCIRFLLGHPQPPRVDPRRNMAMRERLRKVGCHQISR